MITWSSALLSQRCSQYLNLWLVRNALTRLFFGQRPSNLLFLLVAAPTDFRSLMRFLKNICIFSHKNSISKKNCSNVLISSCFLIRLHKETSFYAAHSFLTMAPKLTSARHNKSVSNLLYRFEASFLFIVMVMQAENLKVKAVGTRNQYWTYSRNQP